jgi:type II secretory pathway component GspD/PulD (secretin)
MYGRLGAKRLKTVGSQVPRLQAIPEADVSETRGTQMIAKSSRVTTCILEDAELAQIMRDVAGSAGSNITRAPSIVLIDGQETEMTDLVQRPFLVDLQPQRTEQGSEVKSVVQVLNEGMTTHLSAASTPSGRIHLVSRLTFEKIVSVEAEEVFGIRDEPTTIQDPVHQRKVVHATENLEVGQTLLVDPYVKHETKVSTTTGVPILRNIPYLAKSFTNTTVSPVEQQMIVLIQPSMEAEVASNVER